MEWLKKNFLLLLVLIVVAYFAWSWFFKPENKPADTKKETAEEAAAK